jgi:hypothetical protein
LFLLQNRNLRTCARSGRQDRQHRHPKRHKNLTTLAPPQSYTSL